jgi:hypothetical protein
MPFTAQYDSGSNSNDKKLVTFLVSIALVARRVVALTEVSVRTDNADDEMQRLCCIAQRGRMASRSSALSTKPYTQE